MKKISWMALCFVGALVLLSGCGGGSDSSSSSDSTETSGGGELSKAELVSQGDQICAGYKAKTADLKGEFEEMAEAGLGSAAQRTEAAEVLRQIEPLAEAELNELRALQPPSGDKATIDAMISKEEEVGDLEEKVADVFESGETSELSALIEKGAKLNASAASTAKAYGFEVCGREEK